ncbi:MAG: amylosucrase [Deinococcales bacterium]
MYSSPLSDVDRRWLASLELDEQLPQRQTFLIRLERYLPELLEGLGVYQPSRSQLERLIGLMSWHHATRKDSLRHLDEARLLSPDWFERPEMIAYVAYTERFAGNLRGILEKIPYLESLKVKYLHLMPFLQPRPAPHDGGYAVQNYREVRSDLGDIQDLEELTEALHQHGISLCCDLVLNHVAAEHEWAQKARDGDSKYLDYFYTYPDRQIPDQFEKTLPEVFPDFAPGNFTWDEHLKRWVWTTFNAWQWDLNWSNFEVFLEFADLILWLANKGVDIFRLDAIAFIWKRLGTNCQNLPEVHQITQALSAMARVVAPAVLFKAEAIVPPNDLIYYLGRGRHFGKVSATAYHNSLMVQLWSSLAARDVRLMSYALRQFPQKPSNTAWNTYVRCHDDIGWAIDDADARAVGWDGHAHRRFLSDFYSGKFVGTFARGLVFQENPKTLDRRISGSGASLAGLEQALEQQDQLQIELSIKRLLLMHAVIFSFGGIPLIYMGDEIALLNDYTYLENPETAMDNRWVHRPAMPAELAPETSQYGRAQRQMLNGLKGLIDARIRTPHLHAAIESQVLEPNNPHVFMFVRQHPLGRLLCLFNFSETSQALHIDMHTPYDCIAQQYLRLESGMLWLAGYQAMWLLEASSRHA